MKRITLKMVCWNSIGSACGIGLGLLLFLLLLSPVVKEAEAAEIQPFSADVNTKTSVYVRSAIAVSITNQAKINLTPISTGAFSESSEVSLLVNTNNTTGYEIYLSTGDDSSALLQRNVADDPAQIAPANGTMTANNFREHLNSWGFNLSNMNGVATPTMAGEYIAIPKNGNASVAKTTAPSTNDAYTLKFGAAIGTNLPSGVYSNTVIASVVANPLEVRSLMDISTMQEMTSDICRITLEDESKQLIDIRDGETYWVAKLKDGRCWMTQNLDLDITENMIANGEINPGSSNVEVAWIDNPGDGWAKEQLTSDGRPYWFYKNGSNYYFPPTKTETAEVEATSSFDGVTTFSWDMGKWVWATPLRSDIACGAGATFAQYCRLKLWEDGMPAGFVDVSDTSKWAPTWASQVGELLGKEVWTAVNCTQWENNICVAGEYDPHYLIGNYYQYNAVTAGTGGRITNEDAKSSICPKGWQLPTSGDSLGALKKGSFYNLLSQYGVESAAGGETANIVNSQGYNFTKEPLYFVRGGYFDARYDATWYKMETANYWSALAGSQTDAYMLYSDGNVVEPAHGGQTRRAVGRSVRCINTE